MKAHSFRSDVHLFDTEVVGDSAFADIIAEKPHYYRGALIVGATPRKIKRPIHVFVQAKRKIEESFCRLANSRRFSRWRGYFFQV